MIQRLKTKILADSKRVILQHFQMSEERTKLMLTRINKYSERECEDILNRYLTMFNGRHKNIEQILIRNYSKVSEYIENESNLSHIRKLLIGGYFSCEYSIEGAALFNPSIILHPDQTNLQPDQIRFILSLRATGEGHISSIEFREGIINSNDEIEITNISPYSTLPEYTADNKGQNEEYQCEFNEMSSLSERVIFPFLSLEQKGIEDARFVKFEDNGETKYFGTYTAYDGHNICIRMMESRDFKYFKSHPLKGDGVRDKGMALFPRKINGKYFMIGRQDGFNLYLSESNNLYNWDNYTLLSSPGSTWDLVQIGNCGSPIETDEGWLVITHAVGSFRRYTISAILLDLEDPSIVIGKLNKPLIEPDEEEREGYVPNVVYSCGSIAHGQNLIIPYAMSDVACGFAKVELKKLLNEIKAK